MFNQAIERLLLPFFPLSALFSLIKMIKQRKKMRVIRTRIFVPLCSKWQRWFCSEMLMHRPCRRNITLQITDKYWKEQQ
jgi:hypothetical protein